MADLTNIFDFISKLDQLGSQSTEPVTPPPSLYNSLRTPSTDFSYQPPLDIPRPDYRPEVPPIYGAITTMRRTPQITQIPNSYSKPNIQAIPNAKPGGFNIRNLAQGLLDKLQQTILPGRFPITQLFGNRSGVEKYSRGVNYGTDIGVPAGTPVALPSGRWRVVEAFNQARASGPNNAQGGINRGYGNSILVQNLDSGEKLRFSHLSQVGVNPGQLLTGGRVVGLSGATGNVAGRTGQHLDLEYYNQLGRLADILRSAYSKYL